MGLRLVEEEGLYLAADKYFQNRLQRWRYLSARRSLYWQNPYSWDASVCDREREISFLTGT